MRNIFQVVVLSDSDAVEKLRGQIGPVDPEQAKAEAADSIRAKFAQSLLKNAIHAPSSVEDAKLHFELLQLDWKL